MLRVVMPLLIVFLLAGVALAVFLLTSNIDNMSMPSTSRTDALQSDIKATGTKIAVSATGVSLDNMVDNRFARCQYFIIIIDPGTMQFEALRNPYTAITRDAGISAARMLLEEGVQVVITEIIGPNAFDTLSGAGIQVFSGGGGSVRDAIQGYNEGQLDPITAPTTP